MTPDNTNPQNGKWVQTLQEMSSQLKEGGPDVIEDDLIGYVHRILPDEVEQQVRLNIVTYQSWYDAYRKALEEKIGYQKIMETGDWIAVWNRTHNRLSLPMPTKEETACIALLAGKSELTPIRNLFQSLKQRTSITNIVQLQQITQKSVQHGFLSSEECEIEQSEESEELLLRGDSKNEPQTELAFQLAQPPEELLAGICQQLLENKTLNEEIKQNLLTLADGLLLTDPLKESFADWLKEL